MAEVVSPGHSHGQLPHYSLTYMCDKISLFPSQKGNHRYHLASTHGLELWCWEDRGLSSPNLGSSRAAQQQQAQQVMAREEQLRGRMPAMRAAS